MCSCYLHVTHPRRFFSIFCRWGNALFFFFCFFFQTNVYEFFDFYFSLKRGCFFFLIGQIALLKLHICFKSDFSFIFLFSCVCICVYPCMYVCVPLLSCSWCKKGVREMGMGTWNREAFRRTERWWMGWRVLECENIEEKKKKERYIT